ncbi:glycerophosphodiester phosphodiesterase [Thiocapsa sp.]|uniref:glycerophosphodiester phosphodiesterase n=1 Tax=Thiocapsa sp. TaxID=2024551 RepID=UPI002BE44499|nr:glycerophosphodiester phosphodiesterase [Thiocapsa sp.]HSO81182.1 glycerophosphodiester phosphodiesterase [Thiocapsa sp.]
MFNATYKKTLLAAAALAVFGCQNRSQAGPVETAAPNITPLVIAHRGASGYRPEHTLESYALAIDMGADFIEPDLVLTLDGQMVARHEPMIGATTDVAGHPEFADRKTRRMVDGVEYDDWFATDFTLAEIKTLRAVQSRANRDQQYNGLYEIPTLEQVIALAKQKSMRTGRTIGIYPEIKHSTYHATLTGKKNHKRFGKYFFEKSLLQKLHRAYGNDACAPVWIQSFEVGNLQYLSRRTRINLVQLIDATDVNDDGSVSLIAPYRQPYDFVVSGDTRTFADLLTDAGLDFVKTYADAVSPWKPYLVKTVNDHVDRNGDGYITINDRRVDGSTGVLERAHAKGLQVHSWTFRNDDGGFGFSDPRAEMTYYYDLGFDGLFTEFPETGVKARDASLHSWVPSVIGACNRR